MNEDNPNIPSCGKYAVNMSEEDLANIYIKKWVLKWCKERHPEAFVEAGEFVKKTLSNEEE